MPNRINTLLVEQYKKVFANAKSSVAIGYPGLSVLETNELRTEMAAKKFKIKFVRNRLARIAFKELGHGPVEKILSQQSALCWSEDVVSLARYLVDFQKKHPQVQLRGALVDGQTVIGAEAVKSLSKSPTKEELKSIISGQVLAPAGKLSAAFTGMAGKLASQIKKIAEPEGEGEAAKA